MNAASLMVSIGADVDDFTRGMDRASKAAKKGFTEISDAALQMTEFITVPLVAAGLEFAKLAADAQDAGLRMDRVFGAMSGDVKKQLEDMTNVIPETLAGMEALAVKSDNMLQGLGYGAEKAASLSVEMVKLAGDMSAFAHVPIEDAMNALDKGLAGQTRGLIQFGIVVKQAQILQVARQRGLLDEHKALTQLGTAQIAYDLILDHSTRVQGEAARTSDQASKSFAFLKASAEEAAVSIGTLLLPPLVSLAQGLKGAADAVEHSDPQMKKIVIWGAGAAAALGPAILLIARLGKEIIVLQRASALLAAGEGIAAVIGAIAAAPVATVVAGIALITGALGGLYWIWQKFKGVDDKTPLLNDPALAALLTPKTAGGAAGAAATSTLSPFAEFKEQASLMTAAFDSAIQHGQGLSGIFAGANAIHTQALGYMQAQEGQLTKNGEAAQKIADQMQRIRDIIALSNASPAAAQALLAQIGARPMDAGAAGAASAVDAAEAYRRSLATRSAASQYGVPYNAGAEATIQSRGAVAASANDLALRESLLTLPDGFNAARQAAVEFGEEQRSAREQSALAFEKLKIGLGDVGIHLGEFSQGMQNAVVTIYDSALSFAQGLASQLAGKGKGAGIGGGIGGLLGGIVGSIIAPGIGTAIGSALGGVVGALAGHLFDSPDAAASTAASGLTGLATAANAATAALINIPQGFRVALAQYNAQVPTQSGAPWYPQSGGGTTNNQPIVLVLDGKVIARSTLDALKAAATNRYGKPARWPDMQTV
jgi:hypothetical protein